MLHTTKGIVLRSVKYGETSLVCNIFTRTHGIQSYMVQGVRTSKTGQHRANLLQPATLLDLVVYQKPHGQLQRIREFQLSYIYQSVHEEVIKNSIALFSVELLLKLLPEQATQPELFDFAEDYFQQLDKMALRQVANFPLFFLIQCSRFMGYEINGRYTPDTPHLNLHEGGFSSHTPVVSPYVTEEEANALDALLNKRYFNELDNVEMNAVMRFSLLEWYLAFMHQHTQHLGQMRSLPVLQAVLH